jgi:hypothetical protein
MQTAIEAVPTMQNGAESHGAGRDEEPGLRARVRRESEGERIRRPVALRWSKEKESDGMNCDHQLKRYIEASFCPIPRFEIGSYVRVFACTITIPRDAALCIYLDSGASRIW